MHRAKDRGGRQQTSRIIILQFNIVYTRQNSAQFFAVEKGKISVKASWRQSRKAMQERAEKRAREEPDVSCSWCTALFSAKGKLRARGGAVELVLARWDVPAQAQGNVCVSAGGCVYRCCICSSWVGFSAD